MASTLKILTLTWLKMTGWMVSGGGTFVRRLRDCRKILIPYGDAARTMKLLNGQLAGRFIGHQNFTTASEDA